MNWDTAPQELESLRAQVATLTKERDAYKNTDSFLQSKVSYMSDMQARLDAALAREAKLREALYTRCNYKDEIFDRLYPVDDNALQERLAAERERCVQICIEHPAHTPSNNWGVEAALVDCVVKIRSLK